MDISGLTLKQLKTVVKHSLEAYTKNGKVIPKHLAITYRWLKQETDEDIFKILKDGPARDYIASLLPIGAEGEEDSARNTKEKRSPRKRPGSVQGV